LAQPVFDEVLAHALTYELVLIQRRVVARYRLLQEANLHLQPLTIEAT